MANKQVGFIGLGQMGTPMSRNIMKKGFPLTGYDIVSEQVQRLVQEGARGASSPADAAEGVDVVITMLPGDQQVEDAMLGANGAGQAMRPGSVYVQMSTIKPGTIRRVGATLAERGVRTIDAPVSRGALVHTGGLSIYAGGARDDLEEVRDVLSAMATDILHCGPLGMGQAGKLLNNTVLMVNTAVAGEGMLFALKQGLDPAVAFEVVNQGSAASTAWRDFVPQMLRREFDPAVRFAANLAYKDLSLANEAGNELGAPMVFNGVARELYNALRSNGEGGLHFAAVVKVLERMANFEVRGEPK